MADRKKDVMKIRQAINVGTGVASELLVLSNDPDMAIECSLESAGLDQCKAAIIDRRFRRIEEKVNG